MHRYTEEEIAKKAFELIDDGFLIGLTEENDLPEELNLLDGTSYLIAKPYIIDFDELELEYIIEILERIKIIYNAYDWYEYHIRLINNGSNDNINENIEYPTDYFKFDDINTITVDGLEWYREDLESL